MRPLSLEGVQFLQDEPAERALQRLAAESTDPLARLGALRERDGFSPDEAGWLVDQARLRRKAAGKLPEADALLLIEEALQQASGLEVADWRAGRLAARGHVLDLCAGIGGDSLALARAGLRVSAYELDPVRAAILRHNAAALGLGEQIDVRTEDWTLADPAAFAGATTAFVDPARRVDGRRVLSLQEMCPPLSAILQLRTAVPNLLVKVAPGLDTGELPPDAGLEFVSVGGELKEALLTFGDLHRGTLATVLPGAHELSSEGPRPPRVASPGQFLYEPDPAVIRAGLVRELGQRLDAWQLHGRIAYLSSDARVETPFARSWRVLEHGPFGRKPLVRWLKAHRAGRVTLKKRGVPIETEPLTRRLPKTKGGRALTVFIARTDETPLMILAE